MQANFTADRNPTTSGLFVVDRGPLGQPCRWYDKATDAWSLCAYGAEDALAVKDIPTAIGFLPWKGPVSVKDVPKPVPQVALVAGSMRKGKTLDVVASGPSAKALAIVAKAEAKMAKAPKVKTPKASKVTHADGTIFFREDRQKWVVVVDGKQPAARPTKEGVVKWLTAKFPAIKPTFLE
jgi:hypothetical protein